MKKNMTLKIKDEFRDAIPPLTETRRENLESVILRDGVVLDPLITWKDCIVDGHHRYAIARKHKIPFDVRPKVFTSDKEAVVWIREHHAAQRQVPADLELLWMGEAANFRKQQAIENGKSLTAAAPVQETAEAHSVDPSTVHRAMKHADNVAELHADVQEKYKSGKLRASVNDVAKLAKLPKKDQAKAARLVANGKAKNVKKAIAEVAPQVVGQEKKLDVKKPKNLKFVDQDIQRTYDGFKQMMRNMPTHLVDRVRNSCERILREIEKHLDEE